MQVSHQADHISQVVISKAEVMDFGISSSAEFFNILSSTLYSDQILAVVREVLCNAWDAHIDAGNTATPVDVTLEDNVLTIRDYGKGIAHDMIQPIYGMYGDSTKTHDGKQTGGFGLGSKSPFAYTDHFEVISYHAGAKTIYRMVKASLETGGKPGIIPLASFPTDQTGLSVSIDVQSFVDAKRFLELVHRIAANGEMNVLVNGKSVDTIPFSQATQGFLITNQTLLENKTSSICLRYGNVVYPIEINPAYASSYRKVEWTLSLLAHRHHNSNVSIVFQAPPHSISVTPSRESLSMQEHTIQTITKLLADFRARIVAGIEEECLHIVQASIKEVVQSQAAGTLLRRVPSLPLQDRGTSLVTGPMYLTDAQSIAQRHIQLRYPEFDGFYKRDLKARLEAMIKTAPANRGVLQRFLRDLERPYMAPKKIGNWLQRNVLRKLVRDLLDTPELSVERLKIHDVGYRSPFSLPMAKNVPVTGYYAHTLTSYLPFLRNILVLCHSREAVDRLQKFPQMKELGDTSGFLIYVVPRVSNRIQAARDFFTKKGFTLLDLTIQHPWEASNATAPIEKPATTPRKKGIAKLSGALHQGHYEARLLKNATAERIEDPEFLVRFRSQYEWVSGRFDNFGRNEAKLIVELFGTKGGVVTTPAQEDRYTKQGALLVRQYVLGKILTEFQTNPRLNEYFTHSFEAAKHALAQAGDFIAEDIAPILYASDEICRKYGLTQTRLTSNDQRYLTLWEGIQAHSSRIYSGIPKDVEAIQTFIHSLPPSPANEAFFKKLLGNERLSVFCDVNLKSSLNNPTKAARTVELLEFALG